MNYTHFNKRLIERYKISLTKDEYKRYCNSKDFAIIYKSEDSFVIAIKIHSTLVCAVKSKNGYLITALPIERAIKDIKRSNPRNKKFYERYKTTNNTSTGDHVEAAAL